MREDGSDRADHEQEPPADDERGDRASTRADPSGIRTFRLDHTGIRRILGPLEADLLEMIWLLTPGDAASSTGWTMIGAVCQQLGPGAHYKTVQTVMNRLVEKRLLLRRERGRAYEYRACMTQAQLEAGVTRSIVEGIVRDFGDVAIAQLVKTMHNLRPDQLGLLERLAGETQALTGTADRRTGRDAAPSADSGDASGPADAATTEPAPSEDKRR